MKELDFDELDRAVNSLMSQRTDASDEKTTPVAVPTQPEETTVSPIAVSTAVSVPTLSSGNSIPVISEDMSSQSASPHTSLPRENSQPTPIAASMAVTDRPLMRPTMPAKRSGRFMDLVPSSSQSQSPMKAPASRQGNTLSPVSENLDSEEVTESTPVPAPYVAPAPRREVSRPIPSRSSVSPLAASMSMSSRSEQHDMPDPLDVHMDTVIAQERSESTVEEQPVQDTVADTSSWTPEPTPSVSPFIPDAKVDKRPLGAAASAPVNRLPYERPTQTQSEAVRPTSTEVSQSVPDARRQSSTVQPDTASSAPISIAQQYKQQPRTGDQSHAAVYDTAAHPVEHPVNKKSNLLLILVIAAIIIIGGGGVAVLFYLGYI